MRFTVAKWRHQQWALGSALLAFAGAGVFLARASERWLPLLPPCWFHTLAGLPCPTCGATRATLALARGDWLTALHWHPLAVLVFVAVIAGGALMILFALFNKRLHSRDVDAILSKARWWIAGAIAANWLYLLLNDSLK
ncbi:MAG: DUF2752 domain-containing protein [bacterium]